MGRSSYCAHSTSELTSCWFSYTFDVLPNGNYLWLSAECLERVCVELAPSWHQGCAQGVYQAAVVSQRNHAQVDETSFGNSAQLQVMPKLIKFRHRRCPIQSHAQDHEITSTTAPNSKSRSILWNSFKSDAEFRTAPKSTKSLQIGTQRKVIPKSMESYRGGARPKIRPKPMKSHKINARLKITSKSMKAPQNRAPRKIKPRSAKSLQKRRPIRLGYMHRHLHYPQKANKLDRQGKGK